ADSLVASLAAVLQAEVEKRVAAVQELADRAVADMASAVDRLQNATSAPSKDTAVATPVVLQAPPAPPAGTQLAADDPRLYGRGFEVAETAVGFVRSGFVQFGGSLPLAREVN